MKKTGKAKPIDVVLMSKALVFRQLRNLGW
jgi:hypothetical protein